MTYFIIIENIKRTCTMFAVIDVIENYVGWLWKHVSRLAYQMMQPQEYILNWRPFLLHASQ